MRIHILRSIKHTIMVVSIVWGIKGVVVFARIDVSCI